MSEFLDDLSTNRTFSASARDGELEAVRQARPPVDLRAVPRADWDQYLEHDIVLPDAVSNYLDGAEPPLSADEADGLAEQIAKFHGVTDPYAIVCSVEMQRTGRAWLYVPEVATFVTGFYLDRFDRK